MKRYAKTGRLLAALLFALFVGAFLAWALWPYPQVEVTPGTALTNEPADGTYQTGDVVRWTTTRVCQPAGQTNVTIKARIDFPNGSSTTPIVEREFVVNGEGVCLDNNPTSLFLPGTLPSGTYTVVVAACVPNPTPFPRCVTVDGPTFTMERIALADGATL